MYKRQALDSVDELETDWDQSKESMYKLSYVIRVSAPDLDELKRRCDEVKDFYDDLNVKLAVSYTHLDVYKRQLLVWRKPRQQVQPLGI